MNIKEIEQKSGLARANIRFYENEGFLIPSRMANGYRDYSEDDLELLKRIRLMRELGFSLEQIRQLQINPDSLNRALEQRIITINKEKSTLDDKKIVCQEIRTERISFNRLEAERYLERLEELAKEKTKIAIPAAVSVVEQDVESSAPHPWKRYLARIIDLTICSLLWTLIWVFGFGMIPSQGVWGPIVDTVMGFLLLLVIEPICLSFVTTTLGKWIFGIRVLHQDGRKLGWGEAFNRTKEVLIWGYGLGIPGFSLYRLYRSYKHYSEGWTLSWDEETEYRFKRCETWKSVIGAAAVFILIAVGAVLSANKQYFPVHRGELTIAEFAQNYNYYVRALNPEANMIKTAFLKDNGQYVTEEEMETQGVFIIDVSNMPTLNFEYEVQNGRLRRISFEQNVVSDFIMHSYNKPMLYAAMAFIAAQDDDITLWNQKIFSLMNELAEVLEASSPDGAFQDIEKDFSGVHLSREVTIKNGNPVGDMIFADEGKTAELSVSFSLEIIE